MGMLGEATGSILRLPKVFALVPICTEALSISARQLETLLNHAEKVTLKSRTLLAGRSLADLTTSLDSTSWTVAQCFDHLAQTTNAFVPAISSAMSGAPLLPCNRALRTGALTRLFLRQLEPPYRVRFKVLAPLAPRERDFGAAWGGFEESQAQLVETIRSAAGLAIDQVRVESPVYARFSYNAYGALRMLIAHERRHLWQIEEILKAFSAARA